MRCRQGFHEPPAPYKTYSINSTTLVITGVVSFKVDIYLTVIYDCIMKITEILITEADKQLHEEAWNLWEMANLYPNDTGIADVVIWVSGGGASLQHGPRIKVSNGQKWNPSENSTIPLTGLPRIIGKANISQQQFSEIIKWIEANRTTIQQYWDDQISTADMINSLNKIS